MNPIILTSRLGGFFKLTAVRPDGRQRPLTGWFPNLVTDVGLNRIGQGSYLNACHVGANNTPPAVSDTALAGYIAGTTATQSSSYGAQASPPYYGWKTITYRFAQGTATGNIAEVGIATASANGGSTVMFSRALVLDELGNPTTVTVLSDEVLDVTYQLRLYPPLVDVNQVVTITGSGSHNVIVRASDVTSSSWGFYLGQTGSLTPGGTTYISAFSGLIGPITSSPSGTNGIAVINNLAYGNNNLYRDGTGTYGLNSANFGTGIRSFRWPTTLGLFQAQFDPVIDKTATKTLSVVVRLAWARNV